ncbi:exo-beta-N-acetylmuramidase NamZ domain-containing protein [Brevibacillus sp. H7]|uniref:exo-beta-N-acetylmuramidase NamZ domain-containing protein n=1 Tax=Brevibacillus sp. H7 TaxID=3349138 RepID=UPI0037FCF98A
MKKLLTLLVLAAVLTVIPPFGSFADSTMIQPGNDVLVSHFLSLLEGKKVGLVTNQTGVNSQGIPVMDLLRQNKKFHLTALFAPEHGTRMPTKDMLQQIDLLLFDVQDIGARNSPYLSALQDCMIAAKHYHKPILVLDRPNPLGGNIVEGPVLEEGYRSFVGVDTLPMAHGMTIGELSLFFNRKIGADLTVIPMEGYTRSMIFEDTGLPWVPVSPDIPDMESVFGYMATGLGEGTGVVQADHFKWIGGKEIDPERYAELLNQAGLPGVVFTPEKRGALGGVRLKIVNPHTFNPAKTGIYALFYAHKLNRFPVPQSGKTFAMFDKIMGTRKIGNALANGLTLQQMELLYAEELSAFKERRKPYLIYGETPYRASQPIRDKPAVASNLTPRNDPKPAVHASTETAPRKPDKAVNPAPVAIPVPAPVPAAKPPHKTTDKVAYLTFDDGPSPVTRLVLDTLKQHGVKATFFVVGKNVPGNEAVLKRAVAEGHVIGGHSYSHDYRIIYKDMDSFFTDLEQGNRIIEKATGIKPTVFRFPGGSTNTISKKYQDPLIYSQHEPIMRKIKAEVKRRGYTFIDWNVDNGDAKSNQYTASAAIDNVKRQANDQRELVILMHDSATKLATAKALPAIIEYLKAEGYRFDVLKKERPTVAAVR